METSNSNPFKNLAMLKYGCNLLQYVDCSGRCETPAGLTARPVESECFPRKSTKELKVDIKKGEKE
jgi:hypothetical protein